MVKARLSGRSAVIESDIDETFNFLNLGKMYGAPSNPEFIPFGDEGLYYLNVGSGFIVSRNSIFKWYLVGCKS